MPEAVKNIGASVRARLLRISKEKGQNFDLVLTHYAIERLLYRLTQSRHADRFVLKGAMLLMTWFDEPYRGTRDLDLLSYGDPAPDAVLDVFREVLGQEQPDGVLFDAGSARVSRIREENEYGGLRIRAAADIAGARITVKIDVGFGDATEPPAECSTIRSCSTCQRRGCAVTRGRLWLPRNSMPWWISAWRTAG